MIDPELIKLFVILPWVIGGMLLYTLLVLR